MSSLLLVLVAALAAVTGQVTQQESDKAANFKKRFLEFSKQCATQHDTTLVEVLPLIVKADKDDPKATCYFYCMLDKYKMVNPKGKYNNESLKRFVESIPESKFKKSIQSSSRKCLQEVADAKIDERCVKAYKFTKCFYNNGAGKNANL